VSAVSGPAVELLEREAELAELDSLVRAARAGEGRTVAIEADAGLGKTRLLAHLRTRARRKGLRVLSARAGELERVFPYGVVRQLLEPALAELSEQERAALFEGAASTARPALGLHAEAAEEQLPATSGDLSFATLHGLYWLVAILSQDGPLLLAVDDAHWADAPSLQLLLFLAPRLEELPVLLAVALRPSDDERAGLLRQLAADPSASRIGPGPLGLESTATLLTRALESPAEPSFASACHELTGGNPFLLDELATTLAADGVVPTAANVPLVRGLVPQTVARAVLLRLARLPAGARELARAVAILGDGCEARLAAALAGVEAAAATPPSAGGKADAAAALADALRRAEVLDPEPPLGFVHPLVRNAVYAEIPAGARGRAHARAAALLEASGSPVERVASHLLATEPAGDAGVARKLAGAGRVALGRGAAQPAVTYLRRALDEPPAAADRPELLRLLLSAAARAADAPAFAPFEAELRERLAADPRELLASGADFATLLTGSGRLDQGMEILERAIARADEAGDLMLAVSMEAELISYTQLPPALAHERFARYDGRLAEDSPEQRLALTLRAWWSGQLGEPASKAADLATRALAGGHVFEEHPNLPPLSQAILVLVRADALDTADEAAGRLIATATRRGNVIGLCGGWYARAFSAQRRGERLDSAEADARQAVDTARLHGFAAAAPPLSALLIEVLLDRGELDAAERELDAAGATGDMPEGAWFGTLLLARGKLRLAQGRPGDAADDLLGLRERMARAKFGGTAGWLPGAHGALALAQLEGRRQEACEVAEEDLADARGWGAPSVIAEALAALGVATGGERGVELLREAEALAATTPARLVRMVALVELGTLLARERQPAAAREPLRSALDLARRGGAIALAQRAAHRLAATGEKVPRHTPFGVETLTPSERRVAEMAARGTTNREIAATLYVTIKTVESHPRVAYEKLGIRSRKQLPQALESGPLPLHSNDQPAPSRR